MRTIKIVIISALLFVTSTLRAQGEETDYREVLRVGFKAGLNYSNVYDSESQEFYADPKFGLAAGAFFSVPIGKYLGVQPEILFSQKGFKGEGVLLGSEYNFTRTTNYIDVPLQLAFKPSEFITVLAGPQYSFSLNQKDVFTSSAVSYTQEQEFKNEDIRTHMLGFVAGIDLNFKKVSLGSRFGWDLQNNHSDKTSNIPRYKNHWFQVTLGFSL